MTALRWIVCCIALLSAMGAWAQGGTTLTLTAADALYQEAHRDYQQQEYLAAREKYLQIAEAGYESPELFYNLGTVAARLGRRGEAILYLEKAREQGPRNPDVLANLKQVAPVDNPLTGAGPAEPVRFVTGTLSLSGWMVLFLCMLTVACLLGAWRLARPTRAASGAWRVAIVVSALLTVGVGSLTWLKYYQKILVQNAVVMVPAAVMRSGPAEKFTQLETLPEGTIVRHLQSSADGWVQVQLGDGRKGYLPAPEVVEI